MAWNRLIYILIAITVTCEASSSLVPTPPSSPTRPPTPPSSPTRPPTPPSSPTRPPTPPSSPTPPPTPPSSPTPPPTPPSSPTPPPTTSTFSTLIPDTFYYNCTENGGIKIMNVKNFVKYINDTSSNCSEPTSGGDGSITLDNCGKNTTVTIVLEATHTEGIIGGWHSKTFEIKCEDVNIQPYLLNVTAKQSISDQQTKQVVHMVTNPTPNRIQSLDMKIKAGNKSVPVASVGQKLVIAITIPDRASIKPTVCYATGNNNNVTLWQEQSCKHDEELFGEKWTAKSGEVTNTMYGFRFVGSSPSITITCTVRVCPEGYTGHECDLSTCGSRKRKRISRLPETVTIQRATTTLTIKDSLMIMTSGAGRKTHGLNTVIGIALATVVFLKIKCFQV